MDFFLNKINQTFVPENQWLMVFFLYSSYLKLVFITFFECVNFFPLSVSPESVDKIYLGIMKSDEIFFWSYSSLRNLSLSGFILLELYLRTYCVAPVLLSNRRAMKIWWKLECAETDTDMLCKRMSSRTTDHEQEIKSSVLIMDFQWGNWTTLFFSQ